MQFGRYIRINGRGRPDDERHPVGFETPQNDREEIERIEEIVERVLEEHSETLKKLADE